MEFPPISIPGFVEVLYILLQYQHHHLKAPQNLFIFKSKIGGLFLEFFVCACNFDLSPPKAITWTILKSTKAVLYSSATIIINRQQLFNLTRFYTRLIQF